MEPEENHPTGHKAPQPRCSDYT